MTWFKKIVKGKKKLNRPSRDLPTCLPVVGFPTYSSYWLVHGLQQLREGKGVTVDCFIVSSVSTG